LSRDFSLKAKTARKKLKIYVVFHQFHPPLFSLLQLRSIPLCTLLLLPLHHLNHQRASLWTPTSTITTTIITIITIIKKKKTAVRRYFPRQKAFANTVTMATPTKRRVPPADRARRSLESLPLPGPGIVGVAKILPAFHK
jgi:hypothetical protein